MAHSEHQQVIENLTRTYTNKYRLADMYASGGMYSIYLNPHKPVFARFWVPIMLQDPHIWYGMELLKGPIISKAKFLVESEYPEVQEYVDRQLRLFWSRGVNKALDCLSWGYSGSEVIYEYNKFKQQIDFKELKFLHPKDVRAVTLDGEFMGIEISNIKECYNPRFLSRKKVFWAVHEKKAHRWYGRSRLQGAFEPWWELAQPKGYKSIRHLWFYKHAFSGGVLYYPDGTTQDPESGEEIDNALIAQQMLDMKETGSSIALPNKTGDTRDWEWEDSKAVAIPEGLMDYGDILRDEMWEGIGVPPEVAKSEGTGSFAGRRVPQQAFYSYLQEIANELATDFEEQILRPILVPLTFGEVDFEITPISILQTLQQEEMGLVTGKLPGDDQAQGFDEGGMGEDDGFEEGEDMEGAQSEGEEDYGKENQLSNGRIEDRGSNAFNLSEKAVKNNQNRNKK